MNEVDALKRFILQKLVNANVWGGKHTPLDFVRKGIPEHYRNTHGGQRAFERALRELVNARWIMVIAKRTGKGVDEHVSLNPRMVAEIRGFLESVSPPDALL